MPTPAPRPAGQHAIGVLPAVSTSVVVLIALFAAAVRPLLVLRFAAVAGRGPAFGFPVRSPVLSGWQLLSIQGGAAQGQRLHSALGARASIDVLEVLAHGGLGDYQAAGDLGVGKPIAE
jgi:hypothetical protein